MTKTEPMTPEKLQEIQEFPDSMGMGHLVREIERCWEMEAAVEGEKFRADSAIVAYKESKQAVDHLEAELIRLREREGCLRFDMETFRQQRDAERGEVARLRERLEQEMCNNAPLREQVERLEANSKEEVRIYSDEVNRHDMLKAEHAEMLNVLKNLETLQPITRTIIDALITRVEGVCIRCGKPKRGVHTCLEIVDDKN